MRRPLILVYLLLVAAGGWACGDKLMLVMGARGQIQRFRPALILAYPGQTESAALIRERQLQPAMKRAGHGIQGVEDSVNRH